MIFRRQIAVECGQRLFAWKFCQRLPKLANGEEGGGEGMWRVADGRERERGEE